MRETPNRVGALLPRSWPNRVRSAVVVVIELHAYCYAGRKHLPLVTLKRVA